MTDDLTKYEFASDDLDMGQVDRGSIALYLYHRGNDLEGHRPAVARAIFLAIGITLLPEEETAAADALKAEWERRPFLGNYRWYVAAAMRAVRDCSLTKAEQSVAALASPEEGDAQ